MKKKLEEMFAKCCIKIYSVVLNNVNDKISLQMIRRLEQSLINEFGISLYTNPFIRKHYEEILNINIKRLDRMTS